MMSNEVNERLKRDTHHVSLRENVEEKVGGKGLNPVWDLVVTTDVRPSGGVGLTSDV